MCGIAGIYQYNRQNSLSEKRLTEMRDIMAHRGPDGYGLYIDGTVGLVHRRLSILDLSENGAQPFSSFDGRYHITFNGEIYNYLDLRPELVKDGIPFRSNSDTEVLLYLFIKYGPEMLQRLNGMFSFAIWDKQNRELFVARDRLGVKPLYYSDLNGEFLFASEEKALLKAGVPKTINETKFNEQLLYRYTSGEHTLFANINRLLPGHYMIVNSKGVNMYRWWNLGEKIKQNRDALPADPYEWFTETFKSSLSYRMISDVPVGVLLSGGLDSSCVVSALKQIGYENLSAFTVGFDESFYDESKLAKSVANKFGFKFHQITMKADEVFNKLKEAAWLHDEPLIHQNDAQMLGISRYAKDFVTVLLSGEAADELMGGYVRYKPLKYHKNKKTIICFASIVSGISSNPRLNKLKNYLNRHTSEAVLLNACSLYPEEFNKLKIFFEEDNDWFSYRTKMLEEAKSIYPNEPVRQAMYLDQHTFLCSLLDRNDRMTMGASIECRVPFLDYRLVEMIGALPTDLLLKGKKGKHLLFQSIGKSLPPEIRNFRKNGFAVPWENYLLKNEGFKDVLSDLHKNPLFEYGVFKHISVPQVIDAFRHKQRESTILLRQMLMIHFWYTEFYNKF